MNLSYLICVSLALFSIGILGVLIRRNALVLFLSIEIMLNAANLLFVEFSFSWGDERGLIWVFFVLIVAAMEAAVGLALIIQLFRKTHSVDVDQYLLE